MSTLKWKRPLRGRPPFWSGYWRKQKSELQMSAPMRCRPLRGGTPVWSTARRYCRRPKDKQQTVQESSFKCLISSNDNFLLSLPSLTYLISSCCSSSSSSSFDSISSPLELLSGDSCQVISFCFGLGGVLVCWRLLNAAQLPSLCWSGGTWCGVQEPSCPGGCPVQFPKSQINMFEAFIKCSAL